MGSQSGAPSGPGPILTRFHREIIVPDIERIVTASETRLNGRFDEVFAHFDAVYQRLDRLESEYHMIVAGLKRLEAGPRH